MVNTTQQETVKFIINENSLYKYIFNDGFPHDSNCDISLSILIGKCSQIEMFQVINRLLLLPFVVINSSFLYFNNLLLLILTKFFNWNNRSSNSHCENTKTPFSYIHKSSKSIKKTSLFVIKTYTCWNISIIFANLFIQ